jgi:hypothetical protein
MVESSGTEPVNEQPSQRVAVSETTQAQLELLAKLAQLLAEKALEPPKKKVADQPHPWTIILAALSPALSIIALVVSLQALKTSRQSMEIGQRAYLTIPKGSMSISPAVRLPTNSAELVVGVDYTVEINNVGNTPAKIKRITLQYMIPKGWTHTNKVSAGVVPLPAGSNDIIAIPENATVPPKGSLQRQYGISITTTNPVYPYSLVGLIVNSDNNRGLDENAPFVRLIGTIDYEDVFGQKEREQWCWINSGPSSPRNCLSHELAN